MSEAELTYDDRNLQGLFDELRPDRRKAAFRSAFRRAGNLLKRAAVANLRQRTKSSSELEKGIRVVVYKKVVGFKVTVVPKKANKKTGKGGKGYHTNRQGLQKPVLMWMETGTQPRNTRGCGRRSLFRRVLSLGTGHGGRYTGRMPARPFLGPARDSMASSMVDMLREEVVKSIVKMAEKYGCK